VNAAPVDVDLGPASRVFNVNAPLGAAYVDSGRRFDHRRGWVLRWRRARLIAADQGEQKQRSN
jgi:hypothetical protein